MEKKQRPTLEIDTELYDHYLEHSGMSDAEKKELLQLLWSIICEFVIFGFTLKNTSETAETITHNVDLMVKSNPQAMMNTSTQKEKKADLCSASNEENKGMINTKHKEKKDVGI